MAHKTEDHSDMSLFKNRLWALMEEKDIETEKDLATKLYNAGLVKPGRRNNSYEFEDPDKPKNNAIGAITRRIHDCLNADSADNIKGDLIAAFSIFFGCSADYLYGLIPCRDHAVTDIQDKTGLSAAAIDYLMDANKSEPNVLHPLNFLLKNDNFRMALDHLTDYKYNCISAYLSTNERFTLESRTKEQIRNDYVTDSITIDALYSREYFAIEFLEDGAKDWIKAKQDEVNNMTTEEKTEVLDAHIFGK